MAFNIGDRVVVDLQKMVVLRVENLGGKTEATGTIVDRPGGVLYNVRLDERLAPGVETIDFIGVSHLRASEQ